MEALDRRLPPGEAAVPEPTPTVSGIPRRAGSFERLTDALDYAAEGASGCNFYSARGELTARFSYAELRASAVDLAGRLRGLGLAPGDRVALVAETTPAFIAAFLAAAYAGLLPVPLPVPAAFADRAEHLERLARQLDHCRASLLLQPADQPAPRPRRPVPTLSWGDLAAVAPAAGPLPVADPDAVCYLQYSSGSTRFPRGVAVTHRALLRNCNEISARALQVAPDDRVVSWLPLYHDMGLVGTLLTALACQLSVDLLATEDFARRPGTWLQLLSRNRGTVSYSPCFGYELCRRRAANGQLEGLDLSPWRIAGVGGEMISPAILEGFAAAFAPAGFRRSAFVASYGLAEATLGVTFSPLGRGLATDSVDRKALALRRRAMPREGEGSQLFVRCGSPLPSHRIEIRDGEGRALAPRRVGRIFVRGASVMRGYFDDPEATAEVLDAEGWLDTGDLGYLAEGELVLVGRAKDTIIVNGRNIWPQDLEWAAASLPGVRNQDCAAFAVAEPGQGDTAVMLIQCRSRDATARAALVAAAQARLRQVAGVECRIVLVPPHSLPRTSSGKLNRNLTRERFLAGVYGPPCDRRRSA